MSPNGRTYKYQGGTVETNFTLPVRKASPFGMRKANRLLDQTLSLVLNLRGSGEPQRHCLDAERRNLLDNGQLTRILLLKFNLASRYTHSMAYYTFLLPN